MAATVASLPPPLLVHGRKSFFRSFQKHQVYTAKGESHSTFKATVFERKNHIAVVVKASQEGSDSSTSLGIVKSVQNVWDSSEDRLGLIGLGFAAVVAFWASTNLVGVIDKVPLIPTVLELIGILFSSWFVYRYLLFKPGRGELREIVGNTISAILGQ
ncbi:hypothetical protein HS088_TW12G00356 [Tripterygium wilfordii]|uniref:Cyanobacterial aminoacyl-tRNA synthetase CAAD domain-containing protein n=1 Tax=Tripterygium wilfordii TaxID=458696 RepID=A0A7J7CZA6_TRIWF|nr:protein CURVATURE THYLAKOID 1C, chloroplastic isoform X1 [Tripterygium wilfordii]KAF5739156.1 hypothetical protein HS088_TW12G00356 [Tripterygium wilfordii]